MAKHTAYDKDTATTPFSLDRFNHLISLIGLRMPDWHVLRVAADYPQSPSDLIATCAGSVRAGSFVLDQLPSPRHSEEEYMSSLMQLTEKRLVKVFDHADTDAIRNVLAVAPAHGPLEDVPEVGDVACTWAGNVIVCEIEKRGLPETPPDTYLSIGGHGDYTIVSTSAEICRDLYMRLVCENEGIHIASSPAAHVDPAPIGPWRRKWCEFYKSGYIMSSK